MNCLMCNQLLRHTLTLLELLSFRRWEPPCLCKSCLAKFTLIPHSQRCMGCGRFQLEDEYCSDCKKWLQTYPDSVVRHHAFFPYDPNLKDWLHHYKIKGDVRYARCFSDYLNNFYRQHRDYIFVPLPVSAASQAERGFNQCELLLQAAQIPYLQLLMHSGEGKKQAEKNRSERLKSKQPFSLAPIDFDEQKPIMLFDDLYTTGRTMLHAKEFLLSSGVQSVSSFSIGR